MSDTPDTVTVERLIPAPPEAIFALLADPARHRDIDGSGTVQAAKGPSAKLAVGSQFGMSMKMGLPYSMVNTVIELEPDRRIAWQTRGPGPIGRVVGGRIWRYELEPAEGGTLVRETWDISEEAAVTKLGVKKLAAKTEKNMAATLARIEELVATGTDP